jgi:hypothetical protein
LTTVHDLTFRLEAKLNAAMIEGSWTPSEPAFISVEGQLLGISELKYSVPLIVATIPIMVEVKGNAQLLVRSQDGTIDRLLTDEDLKRVSFSGE